MSLGAPMADGALRLRLDDGALEYYRSAKV